MRSTSIVIDRGGGARDRVRVRDAGRRVVVGGAVTVESTRLVDATTLFARVHLTRQAAGERDVRVANPGIGAGPLTGAVGERRVGLTVA